VNLNSFVVPLTALSLFHLTLLSGLRTNGGVPLPLRNALILRTRTNSPSVFSVGMYGIVCRVAHSV